jgi:hypothetical protein
LICGVVGSGVSGISNCGVVDVCVFVFVVCLCVFGMARWWFVVGRAHFVVTLLRGTISCTLFVSSSSSSFFATQLPLSFNFSLQNIHLLV